MDSTLSPYTKRPIRVEEREIFPSQPVTAPGVEPANYLGILRPEGPPPTGNIAELALMETVESLPSPPMQGSCEQLPAKKHCIIRNPSQFREIAKYFSSDAPRRDDEGNEVSIEASCMSCGSLLEMPDALMPADYPQLEAVPLVVLPCGHMFCSHCLDKHFEFKYELTRTLHHQHYALWEDVCPDCPMCRLPLRYETCLHDMEFRAYDPVRPREDQLPLTIPEGGWIADTCQACAAEDAEDGIVEFSYMVLPDLPRANYTRPTVGGPEHADEARRHLVSMIRDAIQWRDSAISSW